MEIRIRAERRGEAFARDEGSYPKAETLRVTPAMEAGITDHVWTIEEVVAMMETDQGRRRPSPTRVVAWKETLLYYPRISPCIRGIDMNGASGAKMALEKELATYKTKLPELKENNEGKFVLIHGEDIVGVYDSYEDAMKIGYERFKLEAFLVKKIEAVEQAQFVSRYVNPCSADH